MEDSFDVTWEADDGYCGGSRPHSFSIRANVLDGSETEEDLKKLFWEFVQEDFAERVSAVSEDESEFVEWAKQKLAEMAAEEEEN